MPVHMAARPSMGKTAFALNIALHVAAVEKKHVAIFSLEMSKEQLVNRLLAQESHVDSQKIRTGNLSDNDGFVASEQGHYHGIVRYGRSGINE